MAFNPTDLAHLNGHINARNIHAGLGHDDRDPFTRVGRAANDLLFALIRDHLTDAQFVGIRVFFGTGHLANGEISQSVQRVFNALDFQPQIGQRIGNLIHRSFGIQMLFQPGECEFHVRSSSLFAACRPQ